MPVTVQEITMAAPDIVCVEVRDPPITRGQIIDTGAPITSAGSLVTPITNVTNNGSGECRITVGTAIFTTNNCWNGFIGGGDDGNLNNVWGFHSIGGVSGANGVYVTKRISDTVADLIGSVFSGSYTSGGFAVNFGWGGVGWFTYAGTGTPACIIGPQMRHVRTEDVRSTTYLNRAAADVAANYGTIGGRTVTAVYRRTEPYMTGICKGFAGLFQTKATSSQHHIYLKLNGNLAAGSHTITFPAGTGIAPAAFNFSDTTTRAKFIRFNQVGIRAGDVSKLAYFAGWIPAAPNKGAVEIATAYSITAFTIIDALGSTCFTGSVSLRIGPNTAEANGGIDASNPVSNFSNATNMVRICEAPPVGAISTISTAVPAVFTTSAAHGLVNGDVVMLYNVSDSANLGPYQLNWAPLTVSDVTSTTFTLTDTYTLSSVYGYGFPVSGGKVHTTGLDAYTVSTKHAGVVYKTYNTNRAGTYVYNLDFSALTSANIVGKTGPFRIRIAGIGCSDPFEISESSWYSAAKVAAKGVYHHRLGMALDGRFGYTRGNALDGRTRTIYESKLPYAWSELANCMVYGQKVMPEGQVAAPPWITSVTTTFGGSQMDAGDYVQRLEGLEQSAYNLLDIAELCPAGAAAADLGIPTSYECLDPTLYPIATDALPDLVHEAIYILDTYRRTQKGDGRIYSGLGMSAGTGTYIPEPSSMFRGPVYTKSADTFSNYNFAGAAAKLATVLNSLGFTSLASTWQTSAVSAFNWAESIYTTGGTGRFKGTIYPTGGANVVSGGTGYVVGNTLTVVGGTRSVPMTLLVQTVSSGAVVDADILDWGTYTVAPTNPVSVTGGAGSGATFNVYPLGTHDTYYRTTLGIVTNSGMTQANYALGAADIQVFSYYARIMAAGCLFRLTTNSAYETIISQGQLVSPAVTPGTGFWEYMKSPSANSTLAAALISNMDNFLSYLYLSYPEAANTYRNGQYTNGPWYNYGFQGGDLYGAWDVAGMIRMHHYWTHAGANATQAARYLKAIQSQMSFHHGANQSGKTMMSGLGVRNMLQFEPDSFSIGVPNSAGISCYGWSISAPKTAIFQFSTGPFSYIVEYPNPAQLSGSYTYGDDFEAERTEDPPRYILPIWETIHESEFILGQHERTVHQTTVPPLYADFYLWSYDGNTDTGGGTVTPTTTAVQRPRIKLR